MSRLIIDHKWFVVFLVVAFTVALTAGTSSRSLNGNIKNLSEREYFVFTFPMDAKAKLDAYFTKLNALNGFNGVVLIGQSDSIFYTNRFGYANFETRDSLELSSAFQLASVSKQFTAVAILQLYQQGKLKLTDSVASFFPDFPYEGVTIHQLLTHRSGLPNYHYFMQTPEHINKTNIDNQYLINELCSEKYGFIYKPNYRFQYSNTGYAVLASIVETVAGMSFKEYLQLNIFDPLNMTGAFVYDGSNADTLPATIGYTYKWRPASDNNLDCVLGDKGIYCSAIDLFKWDQGLYKGIIINPDTLALAFKPMGKPEKFDANYGYGWRMFNYGPDTLKVVYHGGWWHGFKNILLRIEKDSTTIVVLKNRASGAHINTAAILNILYPTGQNQPMLASDSTNIEDTTEQEFTMVEVHQQLE